MLFQSLQRRAIWNEMLYQSLEERELWLHIALERQVARGMAWIGAWGPGMGRKHRMDGVVAQKSRRPRRRGRRKS